MNVLQVKRYEEAIVVLQRLEQKITSDLANSPLLPYDPDLKQISEEYQSVTYQLGTKLDTKRINDVSGKYKD